MTWTAWPNLDYGHRHCLTPRSPPSCWVWSVLAWRRWSRLNSDTRCARATARPTGPAGHCVVVGWSTRCWMFRCSPTWRTSSRRSWPMRTRPNGRRRSSPTRSASARPSTPPHAGSGQPGRDGCAATPSGASCGLCGSIATRSHANVISRCTASRVTRLWWTWPKRCPRRRPRWPRCPTCHARLWDRPDSGWP